MKKVYVLYGDICHTYEVAKASLEGVLEEEVVFTSNADDIPWDDMDNQVSLFVAMKSDNATLNWESGIDTWITPERERAMLEYVTGGHGILFVHAGLVGYPHDSIIHNLAGGGFIEHPPLTEITFVPVNKTNPIVADVDCFSASDEKYVCQVDPDVEVVLCGMDPVHPGNICGWCKCIGAGKTAAIAQGHTLDIAENEEYRKLLKNAIQWLRA